MSEQNNQGMQIHYFCPRWGSESIPWSQFIENIKNAGFDGIELGIPDTNVEREEVLGMIQEAGLSIIAQHWETADSDFANHKAQYTDHLHRIASTKPYLLNSHTGKDYFTLDQNIELIQIAENIAKEYGISITHETHRGRHSFAAHVMPHYINAIPNIRITLDVSHWICVAESLLQDQQAAITQCVPHIHHIHARIGHTQGPQIDDLSNEKWQLTIARHFEIWDTIMDYQRSQDMMSFAITTEFGPPPYLSSHPKDTTAQAYQFDLNCEMLQLLKKRYNHR
jgi:Xylose isomerase-like TIM barrel